MKLLLLFTSLFLLVQISFSQILPQGSVWKYLDNGSNQDTAWRYIAFNDSLWNSGAAQLGYGDNDENTIISYGNNSSNKYITYYFRKIINIPNLAANAFYSFRLLRDDGAVIYVNGNEVIRSNMPAGVINYNTLSSTTVSGSDENVFYEYILPSTVFTAGDNLIAVEVHQRSASSSDMSFDLEISPSQVIINKGEVWKYKDDGVSQDSLWRFLAFNDTTWSSGAAQLGYGDGDENTIVSFGNSSSNKYITTYFRKIFYVQNPAIAPGISIELLRDDGAIVYLNGVEIIRSNMPLGTISSTSLAASTVSGSDEDNFYQYNISSALLDSGQNIISVEIHQRSASSSDISFDFGLKFSNLSFFRKAPYLLYAGENSKMLILWQLKQTKSCVFKWGIDTTYSLGSNMTTEYGSDHQHKILLSGLNPNTKYFYKVSVDTTNFKIGSFRTGPIDTDKKVSFYAYGDTRTYPYYHNLVAKQIMIDMHNNPQSQTIIVSSGDFVANGNNEADWDNQFFDADYKYIQSMLANLAYVGAMGNHEGQGVLFAKYFPYPMFNNGRYYYSFDYGNIHFTVVDQFTDYSVGSQQYNWLVNDLSSSSKSWKIILLHKPGWSAAGGHSNSSKVQNVIQPLCLSYGVHFVITGHNHYYARAVVDGVQHITTGGGGAPLYNPDANADSIVMVDKSYHFCRIDIDHDTLSFSAIREDGSLIEAFDYINTTTSIDNNKLIEEKFLIYSASKSIIIESKIHREAMVEIYDSLGREIYSAKLIHQKESVHIANVGVYYVRVYLGDKPFVKKVFVH